MKRNMIALLLASCLCHPALATTWQVILGSNFFAPESLVVAYGDTVIWTNVQGTHNVVENSEPPLFSSGPLALAPWSYSFVFLVPLGSYSYYCEAHQPEMTGSIAVIPYGTSPNIGFLNNASVPNNGSVGYGFRMTVAATDEGQDLTGYAMSLIDTNHWSPWSPYPAFLICDTSLGFFPEHTTAISNSLIAAGTLEIYCQAIDSRGYMSPIISRTVNVLADRRPQLDSLITGTYGGPDLYPDGSAYYLPGAGATLVLAATAVQYHGEINAYRARDTSGTWGAWQPMPVFDVANLAPADFSLRFVARDIAGAISDTVNYILHIVEFTLSDSIVIVDETRDGPGGPGAPTDAQVDTFYHSLVTGYPYRDHDYATYGYVSPYSLQNAGLVMYHADDKAELKLGDEVRVLHDYLSRGGRLILSGWDVAGALTMQADSATFSSNSFGYVDLRLISANRLTTRNATGFEGVGLFPSVALDSTKLPASWHGNIDKAWVFTPRESFTEIGRLQVSIANHPLNGRTAAYLYDGEFQVAVFGIPLYFGFTDQAQALMNVLLPMMLGSSAIPTERPPEPLSYALDQNFPNPFNATTEIRFSLPRDDDVTLRVYDLLGREVASLVNQSVSAGVHRIYFEGANLPSGIYLVQLRAGQYVQARKMVLLK